MLQHLIYYACNHLRCFIHFSIELELINDDKKTKDYFRWLLTYAFFKFTYVARMKKYPTENGNQNSRFESSTNIQKRQSESILQTSLKTCVQLKRKGHVYPIKFYEEIYFIVYTGCSFQNCN